MKIGSPFYEQQDSSFPPGFKRKFHVLVINQYFPPDTSATAKVIKDLVTTLAQHHQVTLIAGRPSYDPEEYHPYYLHRREQQGNLWVERVGSFSYDRRRIQGRVANYLSYLFLALLRALTTRPDVVLAMTDPPLACVVGALVAKKIKCPFIYNIRDLHPDMALTAQLLPPSFLTRQWEALHRWALKQADRVIVLGEDMKDRVVAKGVSEQQVEVIRDGASPMNFYPSRENPICQELRGGFPFVTMHAGNIGFYGAWESLLQAFRQLDSSFYGLIMVGGGANQAQVERTANGAPNVRFLPFRPIKDLPYVLSAPDLHLVTIARGFEGLVVPSKFYGILAAGKPTLVVASEQSDAARIVIEHHCGLVADPDKPEEIAQKIEWASRHPETLQEMGEHALRIAPKFDRSKEIERFLKIIETVTCSFKEQRFRNKPGPSGEEKAYVKK